MKDQSSRIIILSLLLILIFCSSLEAGPYTYIGLYADVSHEHCSVYVPFPFTSFETYVWILPNDNGMTGVKFAISGHEEIEISGTTPSYDASGVACDFTADCNVDFDDCQHDWIWVYKCTMIPMAPDIVGQITVIDPPGGVPIVTECTGGTTPLIILNNLSINQPCFTGSESKSWGTIKRLFSN